MRAPLKVFFSKTQHDIEEHQKYLFWCCESSRKIRSNSRNINNSRSINDAITSRNPCTQHDLLYFLNMNNINLIIFLFAYSYFCNIGNLLCLCWTHKLTKSFHLLEIFSNFLCQRCFNANSKSLAVQVDSDLLAGRNDEVPLLILSHSFFYLSSSTYHLFRICSTPFTIIFYVCISVVFWG